MKVQDPSLNQAVIEFICHQVFMLAICCVCLLDKEFGALVANTIVMVMLVILFQHKKFYTVPKERLIKT